MVTMDGEILNDLLRVHKDRISGYERAIAELTDAEDADLKQLFRNYIDNSQSFITELSAALTKMNEPVAVSPAATGKIYNVWMEIKAFFTGNDRQTILNSCEAMEDAVKKAYESALDPSSLLPETFLLISRQSKQLLKAHNEVRKLRDA
ncbi:aldehyde dehydrogenase [Niabella ginsenosidivorans]|uniref:Aldehyde dehydrogenase n=1 Tax=Niabella ginsenosidivorans TaxID=1176587 RepID=A0A1A9I5D2_9BACT|nr:PA2169 family four-helix-bundle protein [Niabella ginsenosidivorans]ANH81881.1 aldehyde dehydrogenase [Niabella ginsenosidivorans]